MMACGLGACTRSIDGVRIGAVADEIAEHEHAIAAEAEAASTASQRLEIRVNVAHHEIAHQPLSLPTSGIRPPGLPAVCNPANAS